MDLRRKYARREGTPFVACPLKARLYTGLFTCIISPNPDICPRMQGLLVSFYMRLREVSNLPKVTKQGRNWTGVQTQAWLQHGGTFFVLFPVLEFWGGRFPFLLGGKWKDFSIQGGIRVRHWQWYHDMRWWWLRWHSIRDSEKRSK